MPEHLETQMNESCIASHRISSPLLGVGEGGKEARREEAGGARAGDRQDGGGGGSGEGATATAAEKRGWVAPKAARGEVFVHSRCYPQP